MGSSWQVVLFNSKEEGTKVKTQSNKINMLWAFCLEPGEIFWFRGQKGKVLDKSGVWLTVRYFHEMNSSKLHGYEKVRI